MTLFSNNAGAMRKQRRYHSTAVDGLFILFSFFFLLNIIKI